MGFDSVCSALAAGPRHMLSLRMVGLVSSRFCPRQHQLARAHCEQGVISDDIRIMRKERRVFS